MFHSSCFVGLQEPGNFVITFPRSFHGGFNLGNSGQAFSPNIILRQILICIIQSSGLNCAEAVNFAPADWLPHGGIGADLYRLYRKAPVLSHEELLYVVAKVREFLPLLSKIHVGGFLMSLNYVD